MQLDRNEWLVRQARRVLQERAAAGRDLSDARVSLLRLFDEQKPVDRKLRALWALWCINAVDKAWLSKQLDHPNENIRVWAIRFLTERDAADGLVVARLARMAAEDTSPMVRLALASALQRIPITQRSALAFRLLEHDKDQNDHNIPLMLWYGIEPLAASNPYELARMAEGTGFSVLRRFVARRLTEDIEHRPESLNQLLQAIAERGSDAAKRDLLEGMCDALRGRRKVPKPAAWDSASKTLLDLSDPKARERALELAVVFGDGRATEELRRVVEDEQADPASRRSALQSLMQSRAPNLLPTVIKLLVNRDLAADAARALANFEDPNLATELVNHYPGFPEDVRAGIIATLSSRPAFARILLQGVASGKIHRSDISAYTARQIQSLGDPEIKELLTRAWGLVRSAGNEEKKQQIASWKTKLTPDALKTANVQHGRELFLKTCGVCHKLYGEGASIGPDLTGSGRQNLDYVLENVVDPSAIVPADYKLSVIEMKDDRVINGMIREEKEKTIAIQTPTEKLVLERIEIQSMRTSPLSLMPEGLLETLKEREVRDLIAYLMTPSRP
jgi:putative heme-binding domain-containing protein